MQDFRNLEVWQMAHQLVMNLYKVTRAFPKEELYGLISQIRRAAVSIPSNIAEGCGRQSDADVKRVLHLAMGSACEVEYQVILSRDLGYLGAPEADLLNAEIASVRRITSALMNRLKPNIWA